MNWFERKWLTVFDGGKDDQVVSMLYKLRVINTDCFREFKMMSHQVYVSLSRKRFKEEARGVNSYTEKQRQQKAPRSIKPTKVR